MTIIIVTITTKPTTEARCELSQTQGVENCRMGKLQDLQVLLKDLLSLLESSEPSEIIPCLQKAHIILPSHIQYLDSGEVNKNVSVQTAWSHQCIVQNVCSIGGRQDNDMIGGTHSCKKDRNSVKTRD